ncbi:MAG: type 4a pilus biogenesis protein PilO, partial [Magnetococcales bacterium]|nr:type 4a pilus biogenesis protein PilO [Magnetococcales bacterium]
AGHEEGLTFLLFAPKPEVPSTIHAEVPVELKIQGSYHETALFMQAVARMARIVTFSDIQMAPDKQNLLVAAKATTYRFLDDAELAEQEQKKSKTKKATQPAKDAKP